MKIQTYLIQQNRSPIIAGAYGEMDSVPLRISSLPTTHKKVIFDPVNGLRFTD